MGGSRQRWEQSFRFQKRASMQTAHPRHAPRLGLHFLRMRRLTSIRFLRVTLAFVVALWMAGAGCLLGCENNVVGATEVNHHAKSSLVESGDACASAHSSSCCAKHDTTAKAAPKTKQSVRPSSFKSSKTPKITTQISADLRTVTNSGSSSTMNCPLAVNASAALSKSGPDKVNGSLIVAAAIQPVVNSLEQVTALARPPRLPNRGHTYLRCCVFLI